MVANAKSSIPHILDTQEDDLLADWVKEQLAATSLRSDLMSQAELEQQSREFLNELKRASTQGNLTDISRPEWSEVRALLANISRSRALQGFSPTETATFVHSFKQPLFARIRESTDGKKAALFDEIWTATILLDKLALVTTESYQQSRDDIIRRQQQELLELSTPVVQLWDGILALPLIGTLDSERTQVVMESLLQSIVDTRSPVAIIDITGVPTVDTLVAQHLMKTVAAARLMGAECIISGIRPQIAQTMVHLGVTMEDIVTKSSIADAFALALQKRGLIVTRQRQQA